MAAVTEARQVGILQAGALPSHSLPRTPTPTPTLGLIPMCPLLPHPP